MGLVAVWCFYCSSLRTLSYSKLPTRPYKKDIHTCKCTKTQAFQSHSLQPTHQLGALCHFCTAKCIKHLPPIHCWQAKLFLPKLENTAAKEQTQNAINGCDIKHPLKTWSHVTLWMSFLSETTSSRWRSLKALRILNPHMSSTHSCGMSHTCFRGSEKMSA